MCVHDLLLLLVQGLSACIQPCGYVSWNGTRKSHWNFHLKFWCVPFTATFDQMIFPKIILSWLDFIRVIFAVIRSPRTRLLSYCCQCKTRFRLITICVITREYTPKRVHSGGGGGALSSNTLMGMCRWMGRIFTTGIDYNGVAFRNRVTRMGSHIFGIWGVRIFWQVGILGIKNIGRFAYKYESNVRVLHSV